MRSFVLFAEVDLFEEVVLSIEKTLESEVMSIKFSALIFRSSLHILNHLVYSSLSGPDRQQSIFVGVVKLSYHKIVLLYTVRLTCLLLLKFSITLKINFHLLELTPNNRQRLLKVSLLFISLIEHFY
jgi:hypothetical protein